MFCYLHHNTTVTDRICEAGRAKVSVRMQLSCCGVAAVPSVDAADVNSAATIVIASRRNSCFVIPRPSARQLRLHHALQPEILLRRLKTKIITKSRKELLMDKRKLVAVGGAVAAIKRPVRNR